MTTLPEANRPAAGHGPQRSDRGAAVVDEAERWARAAWSALAEPGDVVAGALVDALGAVEAWRWLLEAPHRPPAHLDGLGTELARGRLARAVERWSPRAAALASQGWGAAAPAPDVAPFVAPGTRGGSAAVRVLVPGDARWPVGLADLGAAAPACLWVRGDPDALAAGADRPRRAVALVGARAATAYGERVVADLAGGLADAGVVVTSGGAYGIDAAAHRGALVRGGRTVVVAAGGVDRAYPAGNARLVEEAVATGGAVIGEVPPGALPTRSRFLQRNRLIAALSQVTVVVEAAWRSGALSTAHHAARLARPVGAVPGPVTSMASAGCHRLLRDGVAVCVTDAAEVLELAGPAGAAAPEPGDPRGPRPLDGVGPREQRVHDALGTRRGRPLEEIARDARLTTRETATALGLLELAGAALRDASGWRTHA
ncbi:DNA-processing protein DprA [Cellulomonas sp.]|uniref:DNA-processing protein DprA n=1 Tax=Cellulomonas sp. TaxID=40001 RepID=UPI0025833B98|nr:DNA-processing protein DprA [Cellulomonas sp.]MCR6689637.1 DNA-processing protein DprA [Cellulomonas sp.]